jgi:hypothetical protein
MNMRSDLLNLLDLVGQRLFGSYPIYSLFLFLTKKNACILGIGNVFS